MAFDRKMIGLAFIVVCTLALAAPAQAFEYGAFADIKYSSQSADGVDSFAIGSLDLYARQKIDADTEVFFEYLIKNNSDGFYLDLARLYVKRKLNDYVRIGAGRMHSPMGYWNDTYHHGVLVQDTYSRPIFLGYEKVLTTHLVGVTLDGRVGRLHYEFALGNSTFIKTGGGAGIGVSSSSDLSDEKTLFYRFTYGVPGVDLKLGLSGMSGAVVEGSSTSTWGLDVGDTVVDQNIVVLDFKYSKNKFDLLSEYYFITNAAAPGVGVVAGASHDATAYYLQASYNLTTQFRPTLRYETLDKEADDPYFSALATNNYSAVVLALRYELDDSNALILDYRKISFDSGPDDTEVTLDWAFLLF